jgi:phthalate 4,5-cis-dihydrodiol dehydrogenase
MHERGGGAAEPVRLGIAGLGLAGAFMLRAAAAHPRFRLCAAMDPLPRPRQAFAQQFAARVYDNFRELCRDPQVEAVYIASPHHVHASQTIEALDHGKHVLVEKPLALTVEDCDAAVAAADRTRLNVIVGHTHAFDPSIREMHRIIASGELGRLGMILAFNYNDFLLRPHRADEFDDPHGGGIAFNQLSHQIEIVRLLGGNVRSVRAHIGALDAARRAHGHCTTFLALENDAAASITFSAYDFFDSDEFHQWVAEGGTEKVRNRHGSTRAAFLAGNELEAHQALAFGGRVLPIEQPHLPHFGIVIATCERGDLRLSADGLILHGVDGTRELPVRRGLGRPGQGDALDALWAALRDGRSCVHDARWGRATVQVVLAVLQSSASGSEIFLSESAAARIDSAAELTLR